MSLTIQVSAKRCALVLSLVVLVLVVASLGASYLALVPVTHPLLLKVRESVIRLVWLDGECNIPSWFSSCLLLVASSLLALIGIAERRQRAEFTGRWLVLSLIFAFLSLDETAQLHELSIIPLRNTFHTTGLLLYPWIIPAGVAVAILGLSYLRFLAKLPTRTRWLFVAAGITYVGGAIGFEALSGSQASLGGEHTLAYHLTITVEELLEMTGVVVFIYGLLDYIGHRIGSVCLRPAGPAEHQDR
jgi:hypothetical protein